MLKPPQLFVDSLVKCIGYVSMSLFWVWLRNQSWTHVRSILEQKSYKSTKASSILESLNQLGPAWIWENLKQTTELLISFLHFTAMILPGPLLSRPWAIYEDWLAINRSNFRWSGDAKLKRTKCRNSDPRAVGLPWVFFNDKAIHSMLQYIPNIIPKSYVIDAIYQKQRAKDDLWVKNRPSNKRNTEGTKWP